MVEIAASCLDILQRQGLSSMAFQTYFATAKHDLLLGDAATIVREVLQSGDDDGQDAAILFSLLLDEARMSIENDSPYGKAFLEHAQRALEAEVAGCGPVHRMKIAGLYRRVGLPVPDVLMLDPLARDTLPEGPVPDIGGVLAALSAEVEADGGGPYEFFSGLDEMTAGMPEEARAAFVNYLLTLDNPVLERCALYWLLSGTPLVREGAAAGLLEKFQRVGLLADTLFYLPIIRGWLPEGAVRAIVDDIGKRARRKGFAGSLDHNENPIVGDIMASLADGVGAQSISIVGKHKNQTFVAMILLKTRHGIKDAFVIPCRSKREANNIVSQARQETNSVRIERTTAELLLEAALADGIKNGHAPAPGFIDVMDACALSGLRPQERDLSALLDWVDPQGDVRNAPAARLERMLNNEAALDTLFPLTDCWFEDTSETRAIIQGARSARAVEARIWTFLENRRDIWARRFLQTAIILKSARKENQAKLLAASAYALMQKHPLQDIPLMEDIVMTTLDAGGAPLR